MIEPNPEVWSINRTQKELNEARRWWCMETQENEVLGYHTYIPSPYPQTPIFSFMIKYSTSKQEETALQMSKPLTICRSCILGPNLCLTCIRDSICHFLFNARILWPYMGVLMLTIFHILHPFMMFNIFNFSLENKLIRVWKFAYLSVLCKGLLG